MNSFVPIFVINLSRDTEKRQHMMSQAEAHSLEFNFIDAVYGKNLNQSEVDEVYDERLSKVTIGRELSKNELGCALSHLKIYKKMVDEQIEVALILEDDVEISDEIVEILNSWRGFPENWEVMLLGYYSKTSSERISMSSFYGRKKITHTHQAVRLIELAFGAHGYVINLRGAKRMINSLNKIILPLDHYTGSELHTNMYALKPRIITLNKKYKNMSNIDNERNNIFDGLNYSPLNLKNCFFKFKHYVGQLEVVCWLKLLPLRFVKPKEYKNK